MSIQESVRLTNKNGIAVIELDLIGEKVNKLSSAVLARLGEVIKEVKGGQFKALIIKSGKPKNFVAGADIEEIRSLKKREEILTLLPKAHSVFNMLEDLQMPTIAAIHGACVGGGCELILACDYRIASDDKATQIGQPEIKLGIIPGFGGCYRFPRLVGLQAGLDVVLAGKNVDAKKALKMGLVDQVVHVNLLEEAAFKLAQEKMGKPKKIRYYKAPSMMGKFIESFAGKMMAFSQAKKTVLKQTHGHYPAPLKALEVIKKTYGMSNRERALQIEMEGFAETAVTSVSKNLINLFYLTENIKKQSGVKDPNVKPKTVEHIGVLGAGVMGAGIAYVSADRGILVRIKDISNAALAKALQETSNIWSKLESRKRINRFEKTEKMSRLSVGTTYSGFKQMDVVIEAIVEDLNVKKKVFQEVAKECKPDAILLSNTSMLRVDDMAVAVPHPENFAGMHFFNPVDKMPLVEVIRSQKTSDQTVATVFELAKKMGKFPVVVKDSPGFIVNRILVPYMVESLHLLADGVSIDRLDRLFVNKFGMPMGPARLIDEVGWDVSYKIPLLFREAFGARMQLPDCMHQMNTSKRLGKKGRSGFYRFDEKGKELGIDNDIYGAIGLKAPTNKLTDQEIIERGVFIMINEASRALLEEHVVDTPDEVDLAMIMGTGFPPFRGGLLRYADELGAQYIVNQMEVYAAKCGERFKPSQSLRNLSVNNRKFY